MLRGMIIRGIQRRIIFRFTLSLRPFEDIVGANISKYKCPIFGNMEGPSVVDSKACLPDIRIFYSFHFSLAERGMVRILEKNRQFLIEKIGNASWKSSISVLKSGRKPILFHVVLPFYLSSISLRLRWR